MTHELDKFDLKNLEHTTKHELDSGKRVQAVNELILAAVYAKMKEKGVLTDEEEQEKENAGHDENGTLMKEDPTSSTGQREVTPLERTGEDKNPAL